MGSIGIPFRLPDAPARWAAALQDLVAAKPWGVSRDELERIAAMDPLRTELAFAAAAAHLSLRDVPPPPIGTSPDAVDVDEDRTERVRASRAAKKASPLVERCKEALPKLAAAWLLAGRSALWLDDLEGAMAAFRRAALLSSRAKLSSEEEALTDILRILDEGTGRGPHTAAEVWTEALHHGLRSKRWGDGTFRVRVMTEVLSKETLPRELRRTALEARAFSRGGSAAIDDLRMLISWKTEDGSPARSLDHLRLGRELYAHGDEPGAVESASVAQALAPQPTGEVLASAELRHMLGSEALWLALGGAGAAHDPHAAGADLATVHGAWVVLSGRGQLSAMRGDDVGPGAMLAAARALVAADTLQDVALRCEVMAHLGLLVTVYRDSAIGVGWVERAVALAEEAWAAAPLRRAELLHQLGVAQLWRSALVAPTGLEAAEATLLRALTERREHRADELEVAQSLGDLARVSAARRDFVEAAERVAEAYQALTRGLEILDREEAVAPNHERASRRLDALGNLALVSAHRAEIAAGLDVASEELGGLVDDAIGRALTAVDAGLSFASMQDRLAELIEALPAKLRGVRRKRLARLRSEKR